MESIPRVADLFLIVLVAVTAFLVGNSRTQSDYVEIEQDVRGVVQHSSSDGEAIVIHLREGGDRSFRVLNPKPLKDGDIVTGTVLLLPVGEDTVEETLWLVAWPSTMISPGDGTS